MTEDVKVEEKSVAFQAGEDAKRRGIPLRKSAIRFLMPGCQRYYDFIDGYDSAKKAKL